MKVLFDTNIIIDIWKKDEKFFLESFAAYKPADVKYSEADF